MSTVLHSVKDIVNLTLKCIGFSNFEPDCSNNFNPSNIDLSKLESNKIGKLFELIKYGFVEFYYIF